MAITLREPTLPDAPQIAKLHVATWREAYSHLLPAEFFTEDHVQGRHVMWHRILGNPRQDWNIRIAEHNAQVVGFAFAGPSYGGEGQDLPRDRQLFSLYVSAIHHGAGVGQSLLDAAVGDGPAMLWVAKDNPRAVAFYRRNGFAFDGTEQTDPGAPRIVDARMLR
ncbi:MAG: GNAT family N-acetyltransferase [Arthrobacter sp.]|nr:GNAT family N-acetyltransferase [Arthrobacter sp.]